MKTIEDEEIRVEREALKRREKLLNERESELWKHRKNAAGIVADDVLLKEDITDAELNYILGNSEGYVNGFNEAMTVIVSAISSEYRDIPITEDEVYMLMELGRFHERAWLKDFKSKTIAEKAGWKQDFTARSMAWKKVENESD